MSIKATLQVNTVLFPKEKQRNSDIFRANIVDLASIDLI